jgi:hypothetical protein
MNINKASNVIEEIYKTHSASKELARTEIIKLADILTSVGGDARSILLDSSKTTMAEFLDICIVNGITFERKPKDNPPKPRDKIHPVYNGVNPMYRKFTPSRCIKIGDNDE